MTYLLLPLTAALFAVNAAFTRAFQLKFPGRNALLRLYQSLFCLTASLAFAAFHFASKPSFTVTLDEIGFGILFGVFFFGASMSESLGYEHGSMSLTAIIMNMSLFLPIVYSCIALREVPKPMQYVGIAMIVITMVLSADSDRAENGKKSKLWFPIVLLALFTNGMSAVVQKRYLSFNTDDGAMIFMAFAYLTPAVLFFVTSLASAKKKREKLTDHPVSVMLLSAGSGLGSFGGNALLSFLCTRVAGAILYPAVNGGLCIISSLLSFLIFKEKPSAKKLIAILIGASAIVILSL